MIVAMFFQYIHAYDDAIFLVDCTFSLFVPGIVAPAPYFTFAPLLRLGAPEGLSGKHLCLLVFSLSFSISKHSEVSTGQAVVFSNSQVTFH